LAGSKNRRALVIAGDDADARAAVTNLLDEFGFDTLDAGPLRQGWRVQRDTPGYGFAWHHYQLEWGGRLSAVEQGPRGVRSVQHFPRQGFRHRLLLRVACAGLRTGWKTSTRIRLFRDPSTSVSVLVLKTQLIG